MLLSIPKFRLENVPVGDSPSSPACTGGDDAPLRDRFPYERGSNTYTAGHAADSDSSRIPNVFRNLRNLRQGDPIALRDAPGRTYTYRAYEYFVVDPRDIWITKPIAGKQILSLQTCFPAPTFEKRLIAQGELVS